MIKAFCNAIARAVTNPIALLLCIVFQIVWVIVGTKTHWDPYPFVFMLTVSNIIQLVMIFVLGVAQADADAMHETRAWDLHEHLDYIHGSLMNTHDAEGMMNYLVSWAEANKDTDNEQAKALVNEILKIVPQAVA